MYDRWLNVADNAISAYGAQQLRPELTLLLAYMDSMHPESVLEVGSANGGLAWAIMQMESVSHLVTVDVTPHRLRDEWHNRIIAICGNSTDPKIAHLVWAEGDYDIVIIDGGHDWKTASSDWNNYARTAKPGGIVVVHDTQGWHGIVNFDVPELWRHIRTKLDVVDLISQPGWEAGTGIVWAGTDDWWDVL